MGDLAEHVAAGGGVEGECPHDVESVVGGHTVGMAVALTVGITWAKGRDVVVFPAGQHHLSPPARMVATRAGSGPTGSGDRIGTPSRSPTPWIAAANTGMATANRGT